MRQSCQAVATLSLMAMLLITSSSVQAAAQPPDVRLTVVPTRVLAGLPVNLVIAITNLSDQRIEIPNSARLKVTPPAGEPFTAIADESSSPTDTFPLHYGPESTVTVAPGETKSLVRQVNALLSEPEFFWDERMSFPGTYRLTLEIFVGAAAPFQLVQSDEATLTVVEPQGENLIVWNRMQELSENHGWSGQYWNEFALALAKFIARNAPDSDYFPHVAHLKWADTDAEFREGIERGLAMHAGGPVHDILEGALAGWEMERGEEALATGDLDRAVEFFAKARTRAEELKRTTAYPWIRDNLERWLTEELDTEQVLRGRHAVNVEAMSSQDEPVTPFVVCVDPGTSPSDPYIAWFGYENPNRGARFVDRGKQNDLTPSSARDLPPRVFHPGRQRLGFSVTTTAARVTWKLDGATATASRETEPRCTYPSGDTLPLRPVVECVDKSDDHVSVTLGYENPNRVAVRVPIGSDNQLTGTKEQPPTVFEPGRHYNVLKVRVRAGGDVTWTLAGKSVSSVSGTPYCPGVR